MKKAIGYVAPDFRGEVAAGATKVRILPMKKLLRAVRQCPNTPGKVGVGADEQWSED